MQWFSAFERVSIILLVFVLSEETIIAAGRGSHRPHTSSSPLTGSGRKRLRSIYAKSGFFCQVNVFAKHLNMLLSVDYDSTS